MSVETPGAQTLAINRERASWAWVLRDIALPLVLTRFLLTVVGFVAINTMESNPLDNGLAGIPLRHAWLSAWARWDTIWYLRIARDGYSYSAHVQSSVAFFPLYPTMMKLGGLFLGHGDTGLILSGVIVSNLWLFAALYWLWKLMTLDFPADAARRGVMYVLIAPTTVFLSAVYPMSLILALAIGAFYYARIGKWGPAAFLAMLAALARPDGLLLAGGLAFECLAQRSYRWREALPVLLKLVLAPAAALGIWMIFLWRNFGDPLAFVHAQAAWRTEHMTLSARDWDVLWGTLVAVVSAALLVVGWLKVRRSYMIWATAMWLVMAYAGRPVSVPRFCMVLFPIYMVLALFGGRHRFDRLWTATSSVLAVFIMIRFGLRYFVG